jgi:hypothetical protein
MGRPEIPFKANNLILVLLIEVFLILPSNKLKINPMSVLN